MHKRHTPKYIVVLFIVIAGILFWLLNSWWHWLIVGIVAGLYIAYDEYHPRRSNTYYKSTIQSNEKFTLNDALNVMFDVVIVTVIGGLTLWVIDTLLYKLTTFFF